MMRLPQLALGLLFLLLLGSPSALSQPTIIGPAQSAICNRAGILAVGPTTITQIVAGQPGQSIFICGWHITNTGATGTFSIQIGTGANCGTGTVTVVPATNVTSTAPSSDHIDYASIQVPAGNALCVTPSVATISFVVWYSQF